MTILAAVDDSAAARPVLEVAKRLADLLARPVEAIHVQVDGSGDSAAAIAEAAHVPLRFGNGRVATAIASEVKERGAVALVIGARGLPAGASPAGHVALDVVQSVGCTVVVVPPEAADRPLRRVLVAVEGDGLNHGLQGLFEHLGGRAAPEVIAFHVIEPSELPPFADSPVLEAEAFVREFRIRASHSVRADPERIRFEMRVGDPADALVDAIRELDVDLVVLAWHRDLSGGHGALVRDMLADTPVPLVLLSVLPE